MMLKLFIGLILLSGSLQSDNNNISLENRSQLVSVGDKSSILEDPTGDLTIQDIQRKEWQSKFKRSEGGMMEFPPNYSFYWVKINLRIPSTNDFLLFIDEAKLSHADLYYPTEDSSWSVVRNGSSTPLNQKEIIHNFQVYSLKKNEGKPYTIYLRLRPYGLHFPIYLTSSKYFFQLYDARFKLAFGLIIGILLFISLNNLFLFLTTQEGLRLWYFFLSMIFIVYSIYFNGYTIFLFDFQFSKESTHIASILTFLSQLSVLIYGNRFLQIRTHSLWLRWWWRIVLTITSIILLASVVISGYEPVWMALAGINGILTLFTCLLSGFITWYTTNQVNRSIFMIYTSSYILFLFFLMLELAHLNISWPYVFYVRYIDIGFLCESIGLFMAINEQNSIEKNEIEKDKSRVQAENILLINERTLKLEGQVNQRTVELLNKTKVAETLSHDLKIQSDELRELNNLKDKLLSILTHDLRTPLSQLQGVLGLATKALTMEELKVALAQIDKTMGRTIDLSNNLLLWARSQMSGFKTKIDPLHLHQLINNKINFFKPVAEEKKIKLINQVKPDLVFASDENIVGLLVHNLIYNAIKFSNPEGSVTVFANQESGSLVMAIEDTGVGMTSGEAQVILGNSIYTKPGTANESGTGLGLKICKDLIGRIGGQMRVKSELGKGTTFYLDIPEGKG